MATILLVEDEASMRLLTCAKLKHQFTIICAKDGVEALELLERQPVDLIIADVMMPRMDGFSAILRIRQKRNLPILVMSAKTEDSDKVLGLSIGADDYISKPFSPTELVARVKSHLRRYLTLGGAQSGGPLVRVGRLEYDFEAHQLTADGEPVRLTPTETRIMELFFRSPGRVFSAEEIYAGAWGEGNVYAPENTVMVHIRRIREKIELNPKEPEYVKVVWGLGYKLEKH